MDESGDEENESEEEEEEDASQTASPAVTRKNKRKAKDTCHEELPIEDIHIPPRIHACMPRSMFYIICVSTKATQGSKHSMQLYCKCMCS